MSLRKPRSLLRHARTQASCRLLLLSACVLLGTFFTSVYAENRDTSRSQEGKKSDVQNNSASTTAVKKYLLLEGEQSKLVSKASDALVRVKDKPENASLEALLPQAKCVAVFPGVAKASILVGGSHGDGVVTCRTEGGEWSNVSFLDLYKVSFGAELGLKGADVVMLFLSDNALQNLKDGKVTFGANAKAVFANRDFKASTASSNGEVIVYSNETGLFAGAGLDGTYIEVDESELEAFYDETITQVIALTTYDKKGRVKEVEQFMYTLDPEPAQ